MPAPELACMAAQPWEVPAAMLRTAGRNVAQLSPLLPEVPLEVEHSLTGAVLVPACVLVEVPEYGLFPHAQAAPVLSIA